METLVGEKTKVLAINNNQFITICKLQVIALSAKHLILALMLIKSREQNSRGDYFSLISIHI
jgi:hypothetical protein